MEALIDFARDQELTVVPGCPFMASYNKRHQEYQDLVDGDV